VVVSLPYSPLAPDEQAALLTSYGLRSLVPDHADYCPRYRGGVRERDGAYHQGAVWTWLPGYYAVAEFRIGGDAERALIRLEPIRDHLPDAGLGTVGEIFDADPPHAPKGCPAQAWSVAAVAEAWRRIAKSGRRENRAKEGSKTATRESNVRAHRACPRLRAYPNRR
jgi:4-alpha-glucanotransferase